MHQLFIVPSIQQKGNQLFISDVPEVLFQLRKVLRAKVGDSVFFQSDTFDEQGGITRFEVRIIRWTERDIEGELVHKETYAAPYSSVLTMAIALPNKREKAELIVQKLAEIGVDEILFRSAERSVHKQWNEKKADRLYKIAKEAVEQSRGLRIPKIGWCETFRGECEGKRVVVFDKGGTLLSSSLGTSLDLHGPFVGVVGPEGGLTAKDYENFPLAEVVGLGETVLRMETAAIVGGRRLRNLW